MTNPVATNPISASTRTLLGQYDSSRSSIDRLPSPCGLSLATRRYIGSAPKSVTSTRTRVAIGRERPGGERGNAGLVAQRGEVVDAGQAHDLPPRLHVLVGGRLTLILVEAAGVGVLVGLQEPRVEAAPLAYLVRHVLQRRCASSQVPRRLRSVRKRLGIPAAVLEPR